MLLAVSSADLVMAEDVRKMQSDYSMTLTVMIMRTTATT